MKKIAVIATSATRVRVSCAAFAGTSAVSGYWRVVYALVLMDGRSAHAGSSFPGNVARARCAAAAAHHQRTGATTRFIGASGARTRCSISSAACRPRARGRQRAWSAAARQAASGMSSKPVTAKSSPGRAARGQAEHQAERDRVVVADRGGEAGSRTNSVAVLPRRFHARRRAFHQPCGSGVMPAASSRRDGLRGAVGTNSNRRVRRRRRCGDGRARSDVRSPGARRGGCRARGNPSRRRAIRRLNTSTGCAPTRRRTLHRRCLRPATG